MKNVFQDMERNLFPKSSVDFVVYDHQPWDRRCGPVANVPAQVKETMRVFHAIPALKKRMAKTMALVTMPESRWVQKAGSFLDDLVLDFFP